MSDMDSLQALLNLKADQLEDTTRTDIHLAQQELDRLYPGYTAVVKIENEIVLVKTPSSSVATEVRFNQVNIVRILDSTLKSKISYVRVFIR